MSNLEKITNRDIPAYILAAGRGSRLHPFSRLISKPLLPIINKPIILHSIEQLLVAGIDQISVVIKPEEQQIQELLCTEYPERDFNFIIQNNPLGTGHAVLQIENHLEYDDFLVIAGDSLFQGEYIERLSKIHRDKNNTITLALEEMEFDLMRQSSTVDFHDGRVWDIREKPQTRVDILSNLNSAALYIFKQGIFDLIKETEKSIRKEYELASSIKKVISLNKRVGGSVASSVYHISTARDLWEINLKFLSELVSNDSNGNLIGSEVDVPTPEKIHNTIIGDYCSIAAGVTVHNSVILPNSMVKHDIENALVLSDHTESF